MFPHTAHLLLSASKYHSNLEDRAAKALKKPTQTLHLDVEREQESKQGQPHPKDHWDQPVHITPTPHCGELEEVTPGAGLEMPHAGTDPAGNRRALSQMLIIQGVLCQKNETKSFSQS